MIPASGRNCRVTCRRDSSRALLACRPHAVMCSVRLLIFRSEVRHRGIRARRSSVSHTAKVVWREGRQERPPPDSAAYFVGPPL